MCANLGLDDAIHSLQHFYIWICQQRRFCCAALRPHQAAADATKSPQREAAATDGEVPCHQRWEEAMKEVMKKIHIHEKQSRLKSTPSK
mmetsp:Transcript_13091/g.18747  ORF Transcript_13091/g.18747 Transcript_13091/m.18747 type:complete len:89 (-) Transcript_13091:163-429(-)